MEKIDQVKELIEKMEEIKQLIEKLETLKCEMEILQEDYKDIEVSGLWNVIKDFQKVNSNLMNEWNLEYKNFDLVEKAKKKG